MTLLGFLLFRFLLVCAFLETDHTHKMCGGWTSENFEKKDRGYVRPVLFGGTVFFSFFFVLLDYIEAALPFTVINVRTFVLITLPSHIPFLNF